MTGPELDLYRALNDARGCAALLRLVLQEMQEGECDEDTKRELRIPRLPYRVFLLQDDHVEALRQAIHAMGRSVEEAWTPFVAIHPIAA